MFSVHSDGSRGEASGAPYPAYTPPNTHGPKFLNFMQFSWKFWRNCMLALLEGLHSLQRRILDPPLVDIVLLGSVNLKLCLLISKESSRKN